MTDSEKRFEADLLSVVSHDLKTPIYAVRGFIELVRNTGELNERQQYFCDRALAGLDKMQHLVVSLLDMTSAENGLHFQFAECDLGVIIDETVSMLEPLILKRQMTVHQDVDSDLAMVWGDDGRLGQALMNLIGNALKYNPDGGHVWITAINQPDAVRVSVRDSGPGIAPDEQGHVFEAFYRAASAQAGKRDGSGLGLAITQAIIQQHQGEIWVESASGVGSTFSFSLPRYRPSSRNAEDRVAQLRQTLGEGREAGYAGTHEGAIELSDAVDDNAQEASGFTESDSSSDLV